jgi:uncharacterized protein
VKVYVRKIPSSGLVLDQCVPAGEIGLDDKDLRCVSDVTLKAIAERVGMENVVIRGKASADFAVFCGRCLEPVTQRVAQDFILNFDIDSETEFVELDAELRQEMILAFPPVVLCVNDCKGLCPDCGTNLNKEECKCSINPKP